jgi:hypothetical protein
MKFYLKVLYNSNLSKQMIKIFYNGIFAGCRKRPTLLFPALVCLLEEMYDGRRNALLRLCMMELIMVMDELTQEPFDSII